MEKTQITPYTRQEILLDNIAKAIESGGGGGSDINPYTRREILLDNIAKAIENGGGGSGSGSGLVEIKNVAPFQVPDRTTGGTKLFDPATDSLFVLLDESGNYQLVNRALFVCNDTPPAYFNTPFGEAYMILSWSFWQETFDKSFIDDPQFCIVRDAVVLICGFGSSNLLLVKPSDIEYRYTAMK